MINTMLQQKTLFETLTYPEQLKIAQRINDENRKAASKTKAV